MWDFFTENVFPVFVIIFVIFLTGALAFASISLVSLVSKDNERNYVNEDVNRDGEVTIKDLLLVQKYILEREK